MSIALTVLFATRNGQHVLPRTLEAYCRVEQPSHKWKIVVADNGSDDSTPTILASFEKRLPLETVRHLISGKNRALNYALNFLEGKLTILTDDDAKRRSRKFGHRDRWSFCLMAGTLCPSDQERP